MFLKNYALLVLLSINFLNFILRVDGLRVLSKEPHSISEDGSEGINIKTKYGDIIDCIDIYKQPAMDHPLLKNHKIQEKPNFPHGWMESSSIAQVTDVEHLGVRQECPRGTVPIRRNTNKQSSTLPKLLGETLSDNNNMTEPIKMSAVVHVRRKDTRYVAARAQISTQNPKSKLGEYSSSNIWLVDGDNQHFNLILAGWAVNPTLYGDGNTRLSTFWADHIYNTSCFDLTCPGFVQVDRVISMGSVLPNISVPGGPQYLITVNIFQDPKTKNWWLHFGETNTSIGYWPKEIFSHFINGALRLDFGGFVEGLRGQPNPAMGSGILPDGRSNYNYVSYFSNIEYMGQDNVTRSPIEQDIRIYHESAYGVEFHSFTQGKGANFLYGGPNSRNIAKRQYVVVKDMKQIIV